MALTMADFGQRVPRKGARGGGRRHGAAFQLGALLLLIFLLVSMAIIMSVFAMAYQKGDRSDEMLKAVTLATSGSVNGAEAFASNPGAVTPATVYYAVSDGMLVQVPDDGPQVYGVTCAVTDEPRKNGTMYHAVISVSHQGKQVYSLQTARYVSEGREPYGP